MRYPEFYSSMDKINELGNLSTLNIIRLEAVKLSQVVAAIKEQRLSA
jgi:hypothetical protein